MDNVKKLNGVRVAFGLLATVAVTAVAALAAAPAMAQTAQVKHGAVLWESNGCYMCHGTVGQGGVGPGVAIDLVPYVAVSTYVRHPTGDMPPYGENILSDADLRDIYAYLGAQPKPKSANDIKLLPEVHPVSSSDKK
jgi:ubiquinol-cytochrome c reductase cytochrome c subunit